MTEIMNKNVELTDNAQNHISEILREESTEFFRITVLGGGCEGFQYKFDFENEKKDNDNIISTQKVKILIDDTSLNLIQGSKIDYVTELIGSSFKITNPQASSSCGCGTSFSI